MKIQQMHQILKEQQESRLWQNAYMWGYQQTSRKRVKYQSRDLEGPKPFPHPSSPAGGREMVCGGSGDLGLLNT